MADEPFQGFYPPEFTTVPNDLLDRFLAQLSGAELKVLLYIVRRTFGWHQDEASISLNQMERGRTVGGKVVDQGTGLTRKTIYTAVRSLEARNCIIATHHTAPDGTARGTAYRLRVIDRPATPTRELLPGGRGTIPLRQGNHSPRGRGILATPSFREKETGERKDQADALWKETVEMLRRDMNAANYRLTLDGSRALGFDGEVLVVEVSDGHALNALQGRYSPLLARVLGQQAVRFVVTAPGQHE